MEILEAILLFILAVPVSVIAGLLIVGFWSLVWIALEETFYYIKKKL